MNRETLIQEQNEKLAEKVEMIIEILRQRIIEPVAIRYGENVNIEIAPNHDDRVVVGRKDWGSTCVNYTSEGVITDLVDANGDIIDSMTAFAEDLQLAE
ncbi:hypothetical protein [Chitinibacter tainanensis]|uniref:hypothetical protein n=1 Tax=Chitinibacter tainanensis TaxID=230667 RepID=UPI00040BD7AB|nr:hypothetical protein [Chitinibacter tainanensis]